MLDLKITAAICTYNRFDYLPLAIDGLRQQTLASDAFENLIVDNGESDPISLDTELA